MNTMMELKVDLGFACCSCEERVTVTVQCTGEGLGDKVMPVVRVPCPRCGTINQLCFDVDGTVRSVRPSACYWPLPVPSVN